ncbi:MAG: Ribosomal protein L16p/L10e, partial [Frankiaceae bacterium]|nr:Ribosomal protein L16p/L10e [Frankiaceae bacterium]
AYVTNRQIESARIAMTRHIKRGGKVWIYKGDELMTREEQAAQAALRARDQRNRRPRSNTRPSAGGGARDGVNPPVAAPEPVVPVEAAAPAPEPAGEPTAEGS